MALVVRNLPAIAGDTRDEPMHGHQQMVNTKIKLIIIFGAEIEKLYIVSKNKMGS